MCATVKEGNKWSVLNYALCVQKSLKSSANFTDQTDLWSNGSAI